MRGEHGAGRVLAREFGGQGGSGGRVEQPGQRVQIVLGVQP